MSVRASHRHDRQKCVRDGVRCGNVRDARRSIREKLQRSSFAPIMDQSDSQLPELHVTLERKKTFSNVQQMRMERFNLTD
jgi:hypothetical protein